MNFHDIELKSRYPELFHNEDVASELAQARLKARPGRSIGEIFQALLGRVSGQRPNSHPDLRPRSGAHQA